MALSHMLPKDALTLCTVTVLFIYFGFVLWTNVTIILPYWTPLFWAAALSVPLHALKSRLLPSIHEALENDFLDIFASVIGAAVHFVLRFFLGSYIAGAIKSAFLGYCHVIYLLTDERSRKPPSSTVNKDTANEKDGLTADDGALDHVEEDTGDYELHSNYQTLVEQEYDKYARPPNWPSYINLMRAAFIYVSLQFTTFTELRDFFEEVWSGVELGTSSQVTWLLIAIMLHIIYSCLGQLLFMIERFFYPGLSQEEQEKISVLNIVPRLFRRAIRESLNSTLSTVIVFSTLSILGFLGTILSVGVMHDVQGLVVQTHQRVTLLREKQAQRFQAERGTFNHHLVQQADEKLTLAYDAGINWFDPILKEAFPDLAWGTLDWAQNVANIVVDVVTSPKGTTAVRVVNVGTCKAKVEKEPDLSELMHQQQHEHQHEHQHQDPSISPSASTTDERTAKVIPDDPETNEAVEEPELWFIPTLDSIDIYGLGDKATIGFQEIPKQRTAINISQTRRLMYIILGHQGLDTSTMLWGFNAFNDLVFRWILFLLGLLTFTGLKISPLQRVGWMIDQALASSTPNYGSSRLSTSSSPGRVLAKSFEFAISGTFISMLKLSIYHTIFTLVWTRFLTERVMEIGMGEDFVPLKYAWLTSLFGIVLTLFPIAPNWLVALPGAIVHFYIYGRQPTEAIAMVIGHIAMTALVDGVVWDTHVVKSARPGVSSAFWLGLWVFLGGMKWGTKGLLLGPFFFAAVPAIWSALLELRGWPSGLARKNGARARLSSRTSAGAVEDEVCEQKQRNGETRRRYYRREEEEVDERDSYKKQHRRSSSTSSEDTSRG